MSIKAISLVIGSLILVGCSFYRIDSQDTTLDFYPPKASPDQVVYLEKVDRPYEVIGIVTVDTERTRPFDDVLAKMRSEAAILGGDAVTDIHADRDNSAGVQGREFLGNVGIRVRYTAKVVVFK